MVPKLICGRKMSNHENNTEKGKKNVAIEIQNISDRNATFLERTTIRNDYHVLLKDYI